MSMKRNRRYKLARTTLGLSVIVLAASAATSISTAAGNLAVKGESRYLQMVVAPGESLWSIAAMLSEGGSINQVIADIVEVNNLSSADVSAGMKLLVPAR